MKEQTQLVILSIVGAVIIMAAAIFSIAVNNPLPFFGMFGVVTMAGIRISQ